ncbi:hypothetical protein Tco_1154863 [Tanacetum coccineum]
MFNAQKIQKNPIFQISVDILKNTNFFQALTASANVPAIYLQQFWKTMSFNDKTVFDLSADLLRKALAITPVNPAHPFELPPSGDTVLDFVNELGYPEPVELVSSIRTNYVYQPWRAILSLLNQCLTGKTSGSDKPRHPVLQMLWGIVTQTNIDHAELIWEEFIQGIQTFFSHKASHKASLKNPKKKVTPLLIPKPLKEVQAYNLQHSVLHPKSRQLPHQSNKPSRSCLVQEPSKRKLPSEVKKGKPAFQLVDEEDEAQQESIPQREDDDPDLELAKKLSLETPQEKGEGEGDNADLERAIKLSLDPAFLPQGRAPVGGVMIRDPVSEATPKLHEVVGKGKAVVSEEQVAHSLIDLSKKKRTTDQFILARRDQSPPDSTTGPSSRPDDDTSEKGWGPDLSPCKKTRQDQTLGKNYMCSLAGPNPSTWMMNSLQQPTQRRLIGEEIKAREESDSTIPDPSHQTVTSTPPVIAPFTDVTSSEPSLLVTPPPINTEATTITTSLPEITPFIALQLRVARLEYLNDTLAFNREISDALHKVLERHTADLIEKYSVLPGLESVKNQESKKSPKEIIRAKKEQDEEKQDSTHSIRSTDKVDYEEFDLKTLIADEDAMDRKVCKQGERPQEEHMISKKPRESDASASKQHPTLTSTGWQITDTRDAGADSSMHRSDPESGHSEQSSDDISRQDEGNDSDMEDTDNAHIPSVEQERRSSGKVSLEGPAFNLVKAFHKNSVFLQYQMDECHKLLTNKVDLSNPEGHQILRNIYEPLPLGGPPGQVTIQPQFFFNKDLEYLLTGDKERKIALSISKLKAARYLDFGLEELVPSLWVESEREYDISAVYGITHWWFRRKKLYINKHSESSDREAVRSQMRILSVDLGKGFQKSLIQRNLEGSVSFSIFKEKLTICQADKTSLQHGSQVVDLKTCDYYFKKDYTLSLKPEQLSTETEKIKKADEAE